LVTILNETKSIGSSGSVTFTGLPSGAPQNVTLSGVAENCSVAGGSSKLSGPVVGGSTIQVSFDITCSPLTGSVEVSTSTSGSDLDPDGYSVTILSDTKGIGINGSVTFSGLASGTSFDVTLSGVAENCASDGGNSKTSGPVVGGATIPVSFTIACTPLTGSLEVSTSTSGTGTDGNGYLVTVGQDSRSIGVNDTVLFTGLAPGDHSIHLTDVDGQCQVSDSNPRSVTITAGATASSVFAIECTALPVGPILFSSTREPRGIFSVEPDGTGLRSVAEKGVDPAWSPNGEYIVYAAMLDGDSWIQLYRQSATGGEVTRLTDHPKNHSVPAWSPDGSKIAYTRPDYFQEIYVINADGSGPPVNLTNTANQHERNPDWSPDGRTLVFTVARASGQIGLFTLDLTDPVAVPQQLTAGRDEEPVWSPDGTRIAFSRRVGQFGVELWIIDLDSGIETRVAAENNERHPSWSPDGEYLVFVSDRGQDEEHIWKLELSTGQFTQLTFPDPQNPGSEENPTWRW
jgi:TolB protein